tara:strand:+ start:838 stop:1239 length:402 start_codon:yes stop_codon:yes gene_type:complete
MALNQIGAHRFVSLSRPPLLESEQVIVRSKPGVNGVFLSRTGKRSQPFEVVSLRDAISIQDAEQLYRQYQLLIGTGAVNVTWAGLSQAMYGHAFHVLAVTPTSIRSILKGTGGILNGSQAHCRCSWTLQPVIL